MSEENSTNSYSCDDKCSSSSHGHWAKQLTDEEIAKLSSDTNLVSQFRQNKLEKEAKKNWDLFYKRNETNFFRDRHWTTREFNELIAGDDKDDDKDDDNDDNLKTSKPILLEVGCGVGNFVWPLIEEGTKYFIYACDFSPRAINFVQKHHLYDENKCHAFVADITDHNGICRKTNFMNFVKSYRAVIN
jgi:methyltransferase-like protein 6